MIGRFTDLAERVLARPPGLGRVRVVAVDGPTGAGKTTFAARLAEAVRANRATVAQVHTDDLLDGWDDLVTFWPRLEEYVLAPLGRGEPGSYRPYDWVTGRFEARLLPVPVAEVLVIEGVTSARAVVRDRLALSVFLTAPEPLRLRRVLDRDGSTVEPLLRTWMTAEAAHFAADATEEHADLVVTGVPAVAHDPRTEYVRIGRLWR
jgi:uridine kinase